MSKNLLIVFVKNIELGKVKTRLAKTVGNTLALNVYKELVYITENCSKKVTANKHIYFSEFINNNFWIDNIKFVQQGFDLGERMQNAFENGFSEGYQKIILIGSDLPDISEEIIDNGFDLLEDNEVIFGPALDGGYYLVGMMKPQFSVFKNKVWSTDGLLKTTLSELSMLNVKTDLLETLNDIDTFEDLKNSKIYDNEKFHFNSL